MINLLITQVSRNFIFTIFLVIFKIFDYYENIFIIALISSCIIVGEILIDFGSYGAELQIKNHKTRCIGPFSYVKNKILLVAITSLYVFLATDFSNFSKTIILFTCIISAHSNFRRVYIHKNQLFKIESVAGITKSIGIFLSILLFLFLQNLDILTGTIFICYLIENFILYNYYKINFSDNLKLDSSLSFGIHNVLGIIVGYFDLILLSKSMPLEDFGSYAVLARVVNIGLFFASTYALKNMPKWIEEVNRIVLMNLKNIILYGMFGLILVIIILIIGKFNFYVVFMVGLILSVRTLTLFFGSFLTATGQQPYRTIGLVITGLCYLVMLLSFNEINLFQLLIIIVATNICTCLINIIGVYKYQ